MAKNDPFPPGLLQSLSALLHEVDALAHQLKQAAARRCLSHGLHTGRWHVLQTLATHGDCTVPQIGRLRNISRQSVQTVVNALEQAGCVTFIANPAHQRSSLVRITEKGRALLKLTDGVEPGLAEIRWLGFSAEEITTAHSVLKRMREGLEQPAAESRRRRAAPVRKAEPGRAESIPLVAMAENENELPVNLL